MLLLRKEMVMIVLVNRNYMRIHHFVCLIILSYITNKGEDLETEMQTSKPWQENNGGW